MLYTTEQMTAIFSGESHVRAGLQFEAALAAAEARVGVIPTETAEAIASACETAPVDTEQLFRDAIPAGTLAIPIVKMLTAHAGREAGAYVHWGATSQDMIDTAFMLQMRSGIAMLESRVLKLGNRLADLAMEHRHTPMIGRTLNQQALPITFGLKMARSLAMLNRQLTTLRERRERLLVVQFGGAVGTLASLGNNGPAVQRYLAEELDLGVPELPWHTERDRIAEIGAAVGILAGCGDKIAEDLALMVQTEIGEIAEGAGEGKGGSSTMPHKRNPVDITGARAAARLARNATAGLLGSMAQEHERATGAWQTEWELIPNLFQYTDYAFERLVSALQSIEVHPERMRENLELTNGLVMAESLTMALANTIGRSSAYALVQAACSRSLERGTPLLDECTQDAEIASVLSVEEIAAALAPDSYLGSTDIFIESALATWRAST